MPFVRPIATDAAFNTALVDQSAWFDGSADYLSLTFGAGNSTRTGEISYFLQRTDFAIVDMVVFDTFTTGSNNRLSLQYDSQDNINVFVGATKIFETSAVYRDIAFHHVSLQWDTTQATAADRFTLKINGVVPTLSTDNRASIAQNTDLAWGENGATGYVGTYGGSSNFTHGYLAQFVYTDGGSGNSFGEFLTYGTNDTRWAPLADATVVGYASSAGGNSFALTSAIGDGTDASTAGNNLTATSMSHAANGSDNTPSNQHGIWSALDRDNSGLTPIKGGTELQSTSNNTFGALTMSVRSENVTYIEFERTDANAGATAWYVGLARQDTDMQANLNETGSEPAYLYYSNDGDKIVEGTRSAYGSAWNTSGDIVGLLFDGPNGTLTMYLNNSSQGTLTTGLTESSYKVVAGRTGGTTTTSLIVRTIAGDWTYSAPSNGVALNTANLPTPEYQGADWFQAVLYTGDGSSRSITGVGFEPDFLWIKRRDTADSHRLQDVLRGSTIHLESDTTAAETTQADGITSFDSDGFSIGADTANRYNVNTGTYVAWNWLAGSNSGVSNTDGSITSTVSVAEPGHFSFGTYTGTGSNATIGHGLPGAPEIHIVKQRTSVTTLRNWTVGGSVIGSGTQYMGLNSTAAAAADATAWNSTLPNATTISLGTFDGVNGNTDDYVFYAFRSVSALCKVGSYEGNGSSDGPYVSCGFKPRWLMIKASSASSNWQLYDTARAPYNIIGATLLAQDTSAENTGSGWFDLDILGDGFKLRRSAAATNTNGATHIFIAIADIAGGGDLAPILGR